MGRKVDKMEMIRLLNGNARVKNSNLTKFEEGSTIWGNDVDALELKRWSIDDIEEARKALAALFCEAEAGEQITDVVEYALEFFTADESGEFISGSDFELAEPRFFVDFGTGSKVDEKAYSMEEAKEKAIDGIAYTQLPVKIKDRKNGYETIAILPWYGVEPGEDDEPVEEIGGGFYGQFVEF